MAFYECVRTLYIYINYLVITHPTLPPHPPISRSTYPLSTRHTDPVVLSNNPLKHSRVSAEAKLISSSNTHSPLRNAFTNVPWK